jgi:hypothetical protein
MGRSLVKHRVLRAAVVVWGVAVLTVLGGSTSTSRTFGIAEAYAQAPAAVAAEVMVMHATQEPSGSIDPRIGNMPQLTKPPFSAYNTYKLLDKKSVAVERGKSASYALPNGRTLQINAEPLPNKTYKVQASISRPEGGAFLKLLEVTASPNEPFFVAGQTYGKGTLVVAITIRP